MAKRKVGELFGKPIVQGGGDNTLTVNEILLQEEGNKITLSERDSDKVESITNKRVVYFKFIPSFNSSSALAVALRTLMMCSCELYYQDFKYPLNVYCLDHPIPDDTPFIFGISDDYTILQSENNHTYRETYSTIEQKIQLITDGLSPEEKAMFLSYRIYKD